MAGEFIKNRVRQTCTGTGVNDLNILSGTAEVGHLKVAAAFAGNDVGVFVLESGADYEIFYGTVAADTQTLARTIVIESSNSNARIVLDPAQTHKVSSVLPEQLAPYLDGAAKFAKTSIRDAIMESISINDTASLPSSPAHTGQVIIKLGGAAVNDGSGGVYYWDGGSWVKLILSNNIAASNITYSNATSGIPSAHAQGAIDNVDGRLDTAESKLSGIENGATADQTAGEILTLLLTVDGVASNLDADLLDGQHGAYYLARANHTGTQGWGTITGTPTTVAGYAIADVYTQSQVDSALSGKENADADILKADVGDVLTAGYVSDSYSGGTISTGTYTPAPQTGQENYQHIVNGGAFTLAPPAAPCNVVLEILNNASAGAITTSSFTKVTGDAFTTTNTEAFICEIIVSENYSLLRVTAMQ